MRRIKTFYRPFWKSETWLNYYHYPSDSIIVHLGPIMIWIYK